MSFIVDSSVRPSRGRVAGSQTVVFRVRAALAALALLCLYETGSAETWAVKPKASHEKRLAPELDLLQRGEKNIGSL